MRRNEMDQASQPVRNLITNPAMKTKNAGTDTVMVNYAANPTFEGATAYVGGIGGNQATFASAGIVTDKAHSGTKSYKRNNCTVAGQASLKALTNPQGALKVMKGQRLSWSFWIYSTVAGTLSPYWEGRKVSDNTYTGGGVAAIAIPANKWTYVSATSSPVSQDSYADGAGGYNLAVNLGDSVWFDDFCITKTDTPVEYFDGATLAANGYSYSWEGVAHQSSSLRKASASVVRTNLVANPSFKPSGTLSNLRTNHVMNPAFRNTTGTTTTRTNLITNPAFDASASTTDVWTNLVTNPSFEAAGSNIVVRTNQVSNPSFEATSGVTTIRTNQVQNPRGIAAYPDYSGASNQTITGNVAITGHPEGLTTANRVSYAATGSANPGVSFINPAVIGTTYAISAWVYHETIAPTPGSQAFAQAGVISQSSPPAIIQGVWQKISWIYTATSANQIGFRVSAQSGGAGAYLITGIMVETINGILPYFDGATSPAVRTNWVNDPRATSFAVSTQKLGWRNSRWFGGGSGAGTYSLVTGAVDGPIGLTTYARKAWTATGTSNGDTGFDHGYGGTGGLPVTANTYYSASSYLRASSAGKSGAGMQIVFYDAAGTQLTSTVGTTATLTAGVWTRISHTALSPAGAAFMLCISDVDSGTLWAPGETLDGSGLLVEQGGLSTYFDGGVSASGGLTFGWRGTANASISYATDGDYTASWTGTANSSTSILRVNGSTNNPVNNTRTFVHQSSGWANKGTKSLRITPFDSTSVDTFAILESDTGGMRLGMVAGKTYTISGTCRLTAPQLGTPSPSRARRIVLFYNQNNGAYQEVASNAATNDTGAERVKLTFTLPADTTEAFVRLYNGASAGNGDVWWDNINVEEGTTVGDYFDGANPITNLCTNPDFEANTNGWTAENGAVLTRDSNYIPSGGVGGWSGKVTGAGGDVYTTVANVLKGETYTFSVDYRATATQTGTPRITLKVGNGTTATTNIPLTQTTHKRFSVTLTASESGMLVAAIFNGTGASDIFYFDNALIENGASSLYYSGSGDFTYAWTSTANNSTSQQLAPSAAAVVGGNARVFQSGLWSKGPGKSLRLIPNDVSGSNATSTQVPVTLAAGKTYTVLATRFIEKPLTGILNAAYGGKIALIQPGLSTLDSGTALPNTAGEGTIRWTFTVDPAATGQTLRLGHGGTVNSGEVFWDKVLVVEGTYRGEYFDGTVPAFENLVKVAPSVLDGTNLTNTAGVSFAGSTWNRVAVTVGSAAPILRQFVALSDLTHGDTYTVSVTVANDQNFNQNISLDWCDQFSNLTILPGEVRRIKVTASKAVYDNIYRFADLQVNQSTTETRSILYKDWLIEKGTTSGDYYAGTGDFTYAWTGTANASTSVQRANSAQGWSGASNGSVYRSSISPRTGGFCGVIVTKGYNSDGAYFSDVNATAGMTYTFSAWVKASEAMNLSASLRFKDAAQAILQDVNTAVTTQITVGAWSRISASGVAPANTSKLQVMWRNFTSGYIPTQFYIDNAMVEASPILSPYFDGVTPVNQNIASNPSLEVNSSGWGWYAGGSGSGSGTRQTSGGFNGPAFMRMSWTASQTGSNLGGLYTDSTTVTPGETYSASVKIRPSRNQAMRASFEWLNAGGKQVSAAGGLSTDVLANQWSEIKVENVTAPAGAVTVRLTIYSSPTGTPWLVGDTLDADCALIERATTVSPFYEGTGDFTYAWTGVGHASTSIQKATVVSGNQAGRSSGVGFENSQHFTYQSLDENGKKIARWLSPAGTPSSNWRTVNINTASLNYAGIVAGSTYTLIMRYRSSGWGATQTFTVALKDGTSLNAVIGDDTARALNTGWIEYRRTFTALISGLSSTTLYITLPVIPQATTDGIFDISDFALVDGVYNGPVFDGSTAAAGDFSYGWSGTADASISYTKGYGPLNWSPESKLATYITSTGTLIAEVKEPNGGGGRSVVPLSAPGTTLQLVEGRKYTVVVRGRKFDSTTGYRLNGAANYINIPLTTSMSTQTITFTATNNPILYIEHTAAVNTAGAEYEYLGVFEEGDPLAYFDGDTTGSEGLMYRWKGTPYASQSEQIGASVAGFVSESYIKQWALPDGSMRVVNVTGSGSSLQTLPGSVVSGRTYTVLFKAKTTNVGSNARVYGLVSAPVATLTTSWTWYRFTGVANNDRLFFSTQGGFAGRGFDIDHLMVVEGTYTGSYLDGSSYGSRWDGAAHASTSLGMTSSLEALAGKPLAYLTAANAATILGEEISPSQPRTIYTVVDMLQDLAGAALDTIWSYGALSLDDAQDPNKTLIMRLQSQEGGNHNMIYTRRTGGGGKGTLDVPATGRQIFIAGLGENQVLFSGHNFSALGYDDSALAMQVPHQKISMGANSIYHNHVATYIFAGVHNDTVRAEIVKALALKHDVPII